MRRLCLIVCAVICFVVSLAVGTSTALAQSKNLAITDESQAGEDFAFQGEYVGYQAGQGAVGMQIVALGDGKFNAVLYDGGLPGAGWNYSTKKKLSGQRDQSIVRLAGTGLAATLSSNGARLVDASGQFRGQLRKTYRVSPTMGLRPPQNAQVLFAGKATAHFEKAKVTEHGNLLAGVTTKEPVGDFRLHLEFRLPYKPHARGQNRGNSGVYIQRRYEVQVLDSFGLEGVANECGGLYRQQRPELNMCLPPLAWQTYDIYFRASRWSEDGKTKTANARITVFHNGVAVHYRHEVPKKTGAGQPEGPQPLPIYLQDHGNPVMFRNIWIVSGDPFAGRPSLR